MTDLDSTNPVFDLALSFINNTNKHIFLTGKAGTGKTTFLRQIRQSTYKKSIIVAPTGVAAINAEGMTVHALFNLPLKPFFPTNKDSLNSITFNAAKRLLLSELELLIIDEVSMLRVDTLDAIDIILRKLRKEPSLPFGGIQVVYIGDLLQLSPIIKPDEWELLKQHYLSQFFIDSIAFHTTKPVCLTLEKIYRQKDEGFVNLLNRIRMGHNDDKTLLELNQFYHRQKQIDQNDTVVLTTHNNRVEEINSSRLTKLLGEETFFEADITGSFTKAGYPTDATLALKVGAQVMLVKNDKGLQKRFYNGKIGTVERIENELLYIRFANGECIPIEREIWRQIDYQYQQEHDDILEEELGSFQQFPVRLAWAITIHKSQGLTFDSAIIDAADAFLPGQVYVALSRLSSSDHLRFLSVIPSKAIKTHPRIIAFSETTPTYEEAKEELDRNKFIYFGNLIIRLLRFSKAGSALELLVKQYPDDVFALSLQSPMKELIRHSQKFSEELLRVFANVDNYNETFIKRIEKANVYFLKQLEIFFNDPLRKEVEKRKDLSLQKKFTQALEHIQLLFKQKGKELILSQNLIAAWHENQEIDKLLFDERKRYRNKIVKESTKKLTALNQTTNQDYVLSLKMFQEGKTTEQIARARNLTVDSIEYQLSTFLLSGEVKIEQLVSSDLLEKISVTLDDNQDVPLSQMKNRFSDVSFGKLSAAKMYWQLKKKQS